MNTDSALGLINQIIYRPGWVITAEDFTHRFEGTITVKIEYPSQSTDRVEAAGGYATPIVAHATFSLVVGDLNDDTALYRSVLTKILAIEAHEAREFFRVEPTSWAPFHPHRIDGMKRWGQPDTDLTFGIA